MIQELQQVRAKSFELEKDNEMMRADMASVDRWKNQVGSSVRFSHILVLTPTPTPLS